jgi:drug/metabolite transporter (DMT)-like permease
VAGRAWFAALALLAYLAVVERGRVVQACRSVGLAGVGLAACLAVASGAFLAALDHTTVARVLFIQAIAPVLAAVLARVALGEPVSRRTAVAMVIALAGVGVMLGGPGSSDPTGDALALLMALAFAVALVITRHRRDVSMAPATCLSQVLLLLAFLPFASFGEVGGGDALALGLLGGGQIGLGLVLLTIGARLIPAAQVGLITLLEVALGPLWVWLALSERPGAATLAGGAIVVAAIVYQSRT